MSNEAHGVYFSLVSLPRAAGVPQNGLKVLLKENITGINTSYLTDSYIVFTLKMESVSKNTTFALKMMVKSSLEKMISKFFHAGNYFLLLHKSAQDHKFSNKNNDVPTWRDFKIFFSRPLFTVIFRPKMVVLDTDSI